MKAALILTLFGASTAPPICRVGANERLVVAISSEDQVCMQLCENPTDNAQRIQEICAGKLELNIKEVWTKEGGRLVPYARKWFCGASAARLPATYADAIYLSVERGFTGVYADLPKDQRLSCVRLVPEDELK